MRTSPWKRGLHRMTQRSGVGARRGRAWGGPLARAVARSVTNEWSSRWLLGAASAIGITKTKPECASSLQGRSLLAAGSGEAGGSWPAALSLRAEQRNGGQGMES